MLLHQIIYALLFCALCINSNATAQPTFVNTSNKTVTLTLLSYYGNNTDTSAHFTLLKNESIYLDTILPLGYYTLRGDSLSVNDFIISPLENAIYTLTSNKALIISESEENELNSALKTRMSILDDRINNLNILISSARRDYEKVKLLSSSIQNIEVQKNNLIDDALKASPNSFALFMAKAYLDKVKHQTRSTDLNFTAFDENITNTTLLPHIIMTYLKQYTTYDEAGFKTAVDHLLSQTTHPKIKAFTLSFLINLFEDVGPKVVYDHLIETYILGESCSEYDIVNNAELQAYLNIRPGSVIQDFNLDNTSLHEICAQQNHTILFFWSSHCPYCEAILSELKAFYEEAKDLEIIAISLDTKSLPYAAAIKTHPWISFCDFKGWDTPLSRYLKVNKTPFIYQLDRNATILAKDLTIEDLKASIIQE